MACGARILRGGTRIGRAWGRQWGERRAPRDWSSDVCSSDLAGSLNYHDLLVANGGIPTADNRVLLSDGAGVVDAVGEGVTEFAVGDHVVSTFFPVWPAGPAFSAVGHGSDERGVGSGGRGGRRVTGVQTCALPI